MEEMNRARCGQLEGASVPSPSVPPSQHLDVITNPEVLKIYCLGFLWEFNYIGKIEESLTVGDELNLQVKGWIYKFQPAKSQGWFPQAAAFTIKAPIERSSL